MAKQSGSKATNGDGNEIWKKMIGVFWWRRWLLRAGKLSMPVQISSSSLGCVNSRSRMKADRCQYPQPGGVIVCSGREICKQKSSTSQNVWASNKSTIIHLSQTIIKMSNATAKISYGNTLSFDPSPFNLGPIGLSPWVTFNKVWTALMGYPAEEFNFVPGQTPMSTLKETVAMIVVYVCVIFGGREIMRNREPFKLNTLFKIHNFMLTVISGGLLVLFAEQLIPSLWKGGLYENICGASGWTQPLVVLYYVSPGIQ